MSNFKPEILMPRSEGEGGDSPIQLPENMTEIFGGTIEHHLNALLVRHVETARALDRTIKSQHALQETMDRIVMFFKDPSKSVEDAVRELMALLDLQKQLQSEREKLELACNAQEGEHAAITTQMEKLAREHPEVFVLGDAAEA